MPGWQPPHWIRRAVRIGQAYTLVCAIAYLVTLKLAVRHLDGAWSHVAACTAALLAGTALARIRGRRVERVLSQPPGLRCPRCRYSLKFNQGRCPECGTPCIVSTGRFAEVIPAAPGESD